jgi:translocation and assembly module TamB
MDLETKQVWGSAAGEVSGLDLKGVQIARGEVTVIARGPLESPRVEVRARGRALRAAGLTLPEVHASVIGSPRAIEFTASSPGDPRSPRIAVHGEVSRSSPSASPTLAIEASVHGLALAALTPSSGRPRVTGDVDLAADLRGTARAPDLTLTATGTHLLPRGASSCVRPVNVAANVHYDGERAAVRLAASRDGHTILGGDASVKLDVAEVLAGHAIAWEASGGVALSRFPLDAVGDLLGEPVAGELNGRVDVADLHRAASLAADLDVRDLSLDHTAFPDGKIHVVVNGASISASARLQQVDGYAEVGVTGAASWGAALVPALDRTRPVDVSIRAENLRANAAMPFVRGVFSELDGRIDAAAQIRVEPGGEVGHADGAATLRDGVFAVPQIGERFHALAGRVIMKPWGTLRFEGFSAETATGKLTANADLELDGLGLRRANAEVHVASGQSIPIAFEGVPLGRASGDVVTHARMSPDGRRLDVQVTVPSLRVDLPQATARAVQSLDPDPTVRVGVRAGSTVSPPPALRPAEPGSLPYPGADFIPVLLGPPSQPGAPSRFAVRVVIDLGHDVEVKRDTTLAMAVAGRLILDVGEEVRVSGQIQVTRGTIDIQGKQFTIDHGTVSFVGSDPGDPLILATALWDAPDGTRVLADFSGHLKTGRLSLQSDPALSQDEILALILFGSPEGSFGAEAPPGQASPAVAAAGLAGGIVTQALNRAISGITSAGITTRIDTSEASNPRPELSVQLSRNVSARLGYKLGVPAPGENPDRTELTLDWRFYRDWSLTAVVGDQGSTSVDVGWRLRY